MTLKQSINLKCRCILQWCNRGHSPRKETVPQSLTGGFYNIHVRLYMFYLPVLSGHTCMAVRDRIVGAMANSLATYCYHQIKLCLA